MSLWLRISARPWPSAGRQKSPTRPSPVERLQHSLDAPTLQLDRRPWLFTPWLFSRSSRLNSSRLWTRLAQTSQRSGNRDHQNHGPGDWQAHGLLSGARAPHVVESDGDQGCRQDPLPRLTSLPNWPVRSRGGRICRALHCSIEVQPTAVIADILKHKHFKKESRFPVPHNTSGASPHGDNQLEAIQPLVTWATAWQVIPEVSDWVMGIIKWGYSLQFTRRVISVFECQRRGSHLC